MDATTPSIQALADIRVLDLSRILAGPYATMMLADLGAEVIKVEQPGVGDGTRAWGPPWVGPFSAYYLSVNRNKRSVTINLKSEQGRELIKALAARSDILVENFKAGTMERLGLDYDSLAAIHPGLIYCSISGYGQTGPYKDRPGYDFMIQAHGGIMSITGPVEGPPYKVGVAVVDVTAGLYAVSAILAALHHRERTGQGQYIDIALLDAQVGWLVNVAQNYFATGEKPKRYGNAHPNIVPYETFETADGYLALAVGADAQYQRLCQVIGRPDLWEDARFQTNAGRVTHRDILIPQLQEVFRSRPTQAWLDALWAATIPASPINDIPAVFADPQVQHRGMAQTIQHPQAGELTLLGPVPKLSRTPAAIRTPPPMLGEHTDAVLQELLGLGGDAIAHLREEGVI
ncbi:MAG TPA: CoA transferase [Anaerolineae bacterium]|nr:CoA transferase [Caldilineae bacterium]HID33138.1 CoA transferase [Anaerolineae bacterium]HIQ12343.1 CoA transferase [Caldilineales bacterium]